MVVDDKMRAYLRYYLRSEVSIQAEFRDNQQVNLVKIAWKECDIRTAQWLLDRLCARF